MKPKWIRWLTYGLAGGIVLVTGLVLYRKTNGESGSGVEGGRTSPETTNGNGTVRSLGKRYAIPSDRPTNLSRQMLFVRHELEAIVSLLPNQSNGRINAEVEEFMDALKKGKENLQSLVRDN